METETMTGEKLNKTNTEHKHCEYDNMYPPLHDTQFGGSPSAGGGMQDTVNSSGCPQKPASYNVVIGPSQRRFKDFDCQEIRDILKQTKTKYGVNIKPTYTKFGSLFIEIVADKDEAAAKANFSLRERLRVQAKEVFRVDPKHARAVFGEHRRNLWKFTKDLYADITFDSSSGKITIIGGEESVKRVSKLFHEYITFTLESESVELSIPYAYHGIIREKDRAEFDRIITKEGYKARITFPSSSESPDNIIILGKKKDVEEVASGLKTLYLKLAKCYEYEKITFFDSQKQHVYGLFDLKMLREQQDTYLTYQSMSGGVNFLHVIGPNDSVQRVIGKLHSVLKLNFVATIHVSYHHCLFLNVLPDFIENLQKMHQELQFSIDPMKESIYVQGEADKVNELCPKVEGFIADISKTLTYDVIEVRNDHLAFVTGKNNETLKKIIEEHKANVFVEKNRKHAHLARRFQLENSSLLVIVGYRSGVKSTKQKLLQLAKVRGQFVTREVDAPTHLHKFIIGAKGNALKELTANVGPNSTVSFSPGQGAMGKATIIGPAEEVERLTEAVEKQLALHDNTHNRTEVAVSKNLFPMVFEKGGDYISHLKKKTGVSSIILPRNSDQGETVVIVGKKESVVKAKQLIKERQDELSSYVKGELVVPQKLMPFIAGIGKSLVNAVVQDLGPMVQVVIPDADSKDRRILLCGPSDSVTNVKKALDKVFKADHSDYYYEEVKVGNQFRSWLHESKENNVHDTIGGNDVRINFHWGKTNNGESNVVLIIGKEKDVKKSRESILKVVRERENSMEKSVTIPAKYRKEFLTKRGKDGTSFINGLSNEFEGIKISISPVLQNTDVLAASVKGSKEFVPAVCERIEAFVTSLNNHVTESVDVPACDFISSLRKNFGIIRQISDQHKVELILPQDLRDENGKFIQTSPSQMATVKVNGPPNGVKDAIVDIKENFVFVSKTIKVHRSNHRVLIGAGGENLRNLCFKHKVDIKLNSTSDPSDVIVTGRKVDVEEASLYIEKSFENSHHISLFVNRVHYTKLIGKKGVTIKKFNSDYNVRVLFPSADSSDPDMVEIVGPEDAIITARDKILETISAWELHVTRRIVVSFHVKRYLYANGRAVVNKLSKDHRVYIKFEISPTAKDDNSSKVLLITGLPEDVDDCVNEINAICDSLEEDMEDIMMYQVPKDQSYVLDISGIMQGQSTANTGVQSSHTRNKFGEGVLRTVDKRLGAGKDRGETNTNGTTSVSNGSDQAGRSDYNGRDVSPVTDGGPSLIAGHEADGVWS